MCVCVWGGGGGGGGGGVGGGGRIQERYERQAVKPREQKVPSLRATTPPCACEPVPEVETDVSDSGAPVFPNLLMMQLIEKTSQYCAIQAESLQHL